MSDPSIVAVLDGAASNYTLLGILTTTDSHDAGPKHQPGHYICPVVAVPGLDANALHTIQAFETANQIKKSGIGGLQLYRKTGNQMAGT